MKAINASVYIQHPDGTDDHGFVNRKSVDLPNIQTSAHLTKSLTAYISRGVNVVFLKCPVLYQYFLASDIHITCWIKWINALTVKYLNI